MAKYGVAFEGVDEPAPADAAGARRAGASEHRDGDSSVLRRDDALVD